MPRREMEKNEELEEGEIREDLDTDLSYIGEKISKALGKFQKEWTERFRVNNLGTKLDEYGSFLVVHQRSPSNFSQFSGRSAPQKILKVYTPEELPMEIFQFYTEEGNYPPLSPLPKSVLHLAEKVIKPSHQDCNIAHNEKRPSKTSQTSQKVLKVYTQEDLLMEIFQFYTEEEGNYPPLSPLPKSVLRLSEKVIKPSHQDCNTAHNVKSPSKTSQTSQKQKVKLSSVGFVKEHPIDGRVTRNEQMKNMHSKDDHNDHHHNNNNTIIVDREQLPDSTGFAKHEEADGNASDAYDLWVACDRCNKWRLLPYGTDSKELPEKWRCSMQKWLPVGMNKCHISEEVTTNTFYEQYRNEGNSFDKNGKRKIQ